MSPQSADRLSDEIAAIARRLVRREVTPRGAVRLTNAATRVAIAGLRASRAAGTLSRTGLRSALGGVS